MPITGANTHPAPTNIINSVKGWNTRHIYNYYGTPNFTDFDYTTQTSGDYTKNLFQTIEDFGTANGVNMFKGGFKFPPRYFLSGKYLKIKSILFVSSGANTDAQLQLNIAVENEKSGYVTLGSSNKSRSHAFGNGETRATLLDIEIICRGLESMDKPPKLQMLATGYIRYGLIKGIDNDANDSNFLIPIFPFQTNGVLAEVDSDLTQSPAVNTINLNFSGSSRLQTINVISLSIEELE